MVADAGSDSATMDVGTADAGTDDAGNDDAGNDDASTEDAGGDDAGTDASPDDVGTDDAGPSNVVVSVVDAQAWANCMPIVPPDPLRFFLDLRYDNSAGASDATAEITAATLSFDDPTSSTTSIAFDVESVAISAGATVDQTHAKTTSEPIVASCAICSSERMMTYDVTIEVDGASQNVTGTIGFGCTF